MSLIKLKVSTNSQKYSIIIGNNILNKINKFLKESSISFNQCLLVIDENIPKNLTLIKMNAVKFLEHEIDSLTLKLKPLENFIIPGGHILISYAHLARCVCRRAERQVIELQQEASISSILIVYMNRLSDYFFTLSRTFAAELKIEEIKWSGN